MKTCPVVSVRGGRPDQVQLIFNRRVTKRTPGRFRTRVLTEGVTPSLHVDDKHSKTTPDQLTCGQLTCGQLTYQLRRLRLHGIIERIPQTHRYQLTQPGLLVIDKYTTIYNRILRPEFANIPNAVPSLKT